MYSVCIRGVKERDGGSDGERGGRDKEREREREREREIERERERRFMGAHLRDAVKNVVV